MRYDIEFGPDGDFVVCQRFVNGEWVEVSRLMCPGSQVEDAHANSAL